MKTPLRYQITEYDCGQTSLLNAISYLYEREEIPIPIIKLIEKYTLDKGKEGTSVKAMQKITESLNNQKDLKIKLTHITGQKLSKKTIKNAIKNNGTILIKCYLTEEHYVIITKIKKNKVYIFDPYYLKQIKKDKQIKIVNKKPFTYNRIVSLKRLHSQTNKDFSLGKKEQIEYIIIKKYR